MIDLAEGSPLLAELMDALVEYNLTRVRKWGMKGKCPTRATCLSAPCSAMTSSAFRFTQAWGRGGISALIAATPTLASKGCSD